MVRALTWNNQHSGDSNLSFDQKTDQKSFSDRKRGTFAYLFAFSKELKYLLIVAVSLMVSSSRKCLRLIKIIRLCLWGSFCLFTEDKRLNRCF